MKKGVLLTTCLIFLFGSIIYAFQIEEGLFESESKIVEIPLAEESTADLYQQYYQLQLQEEAADEKRGERHRIYNDAKRNARARLAEDPNNIEHHRTLLRAQRIWDVAYENWNEEFHGIRHQMDAICEELAKRGEPPPSS